MQDNYQEVLIVLVAGMIIFFVLSGIMTYILLFYQRKRFQHKKEIIEIEKKFTETLLLSQLEVQEQSFNLISREIHDNVGQVLSLAKIQLNIIEEGQEVSKEQLVEVKENIGKALTDLREIARNLNSDRMDNVSLLEVVGQEIQRIRRSGIMQTEFQASGEERSFNHQKRLIILRVIQECIQNILKHAKAEKLSVNFDYQEEGLKVIIHDDGVGFDLQEISTHSVGMGLGNIRTRVSLMGGTALINSQQNEGTVVTIQIPYG